MPGSIFIIHGNNELTEVSEQPYDSESVLQELLARYPNLLAGDQMNRLAPRRWLLVAQEVPLPGEEAGLGRWSVDHLFVDQDAIPTIVETKRSTDTRIRREVVGQMLEYAANAVSYWPTADLRRAYEDRVKVDGPNAGQLPDGFLEPDADFDAFWDQVGTNLKAGKVRLVFVADEIPSELRRIVSFMGEQMRPAEVFAVEVRHFVGKDVKALVPNVVVFPPAPPQPPPSRRWDEQSFLAALSSKGLGQKDAAAQILTWAKQRRLRIAWGGGNVQGLLYPMFDHGGMNNYTCVVSTGFTAGYVQLCFRDMQTRPPFDQVAFREELRSRLCSIDGVAIPPDAIARYPSFSLASLQTKTSIDLFLATMDWVIDQVKRHYDTSAQRV